MAGEQHVLRIPRADGDAEGGYVVLQVTRKSSRPLDLDFVGSESEHVYVGSGKRPSASLHVPGLWGKDAGSTRASRVGVTQRAHRSFISAPSAFRRGILVKR